MSIHLILSAAPTIPAGLHEHIVETFGDDVRQITDFQWVLSADMTARGISDLLGASNGAYGRIMVASVSNFWGWHDKDLWSWIELKRSI